MIDFDFLQGAWEKLTGEDDDELVSGELDDDATHQVGSDGRFVDMDGDGYAETYMSYEGQDWDGDGLANFTVEHVGVDLDGDGTADVFSHVERTDRDGDGIFETVKYQEQSDTNGDGVVDYMTSGYYSDKDLDGEIDNAYSTTSVDRDYDGFMEENEVTNAQDYNDDGVVDYMSLTGHDQYSSESGEFLDQDHDGTLETYKFSGSGDMDKDGNTDYTFTGYGSDRDGDGLAENSYRYEQMDLNSDGILETHGSYESKDWTQDGRPDSIDHVVEMDLDGDGLIDYQDTQEDPGPVTMPTEDVLDYIFTAPDKRYGFGDEDLTPDGDEDSMPEFENDDEEEEDPHTLPDRNDRDFQEEMDLFVNPDQEEPEDVPTEIPEEDDQEDVPAEIPEQDDQEDVPAAEPEEEEPEEPVLIPEEEEEEDQPDEEEAEPLPEPEEEEDPYVDPNPGEPYYAPEGENALDYGGAPAFDAYDPSRSNPDALAGDPSDALNCWHWQETNSSCAVASQEFVLEQLLDREFTEAELRDLAQSNGWYDEGGTPLNCVGNLLELMGLDVEKTSGNTATDLENSLAEGDKIIVAVDSDELWFGDDDDAFEPGLDSNHALQVVAIDRTYPDNPMVIVNDSGCANGECAMIPMDLFMEAWEDSNYFMVQANV